MEQYNEAKAEAAHQDILDLLEEEIQLSHIQSVLYQQDLRCYHDKQFRGCAFKEGDLILRLDQQQPHKLAPPWKGPHAISKVLHNGAYRLYNLKNEVEEPKISNVDLLCKFYT